MATHTWHPLTPGPSESPSLQWPPVYSGPKRAFCPCIGLNRLGFKTHSLNTQTNTYRSNTRPTPLTNYRYSWTNTLGVIGVDVAPAGTVSPPGDRRWQSFCSRSDRSNFGSIVTFFKGYASRCLAMEEKCGHLDRLQTESVYILLYKSLDRI